MRATVEINRPWPSAGTRNVAASANNARYDPRNGTPNACVASSAQPNVATSPSPKYGSNLPSRISVRVAGVDINASIVPRSHSRATTSAVSSVPINVMMIAIAPGIRNRRLLISGLNQKRASSASGRVMFAASSRPLNQEPTTPRAYAATKVAVFGCEPSVMICTSAARLPSFKRASKSCGMTTNPRSRPDTTPGATSRRSRAGVTTK